MHVGTDQLTKTQFRDELIKRFFHPDSYFSHCFGNLLQSLLDKGENSNNNEYLLVGNLMDKLVASENVLTDVESLIQLNGFQGFGSRLKEGVQYLCDSDLDPEKMKIEIESLANSFFQDALDAVRNNPQQTSLKQFLGMQNGEQSSELSLEINEDDIIFDPKEPSSEEPEANAESTSEELDDIHASQDILQGSESFQQEQSMDAPDSGGYGNDSFKEDGSLEFESEQTESADLSKEESIDGVQQVLEKVIFSLNQDLETLRASIDAGPLANMAVKELLMTFEKIASTAMIYGLDPVEEIAEKARRFLVFAQKSGLDNDLVSSLIREVLQVVMDILDSGIDKIDNQAVQDLCGKLSDPSRLSSSFDLPINDHQPTEFNETKAEHENLNEKSFELSQFKLPGEDEIVGLIEEISNQKTEENETPEEKAHSNELHLEREVLVANISDSTPPDDFLKYKQQAKLYFRVMEQALDTLMGQPGHRTALEDIQLACDSLQKIIMQYGLNELAKLPSLLSDLMKEVVSSRYSLLKPENDVIKNAFEQFRLLNNTGDTETEEFRNVLVSVQTLISKVKMHAEEEQGWRNIEKFKHRR